MKILFLTQWFDPEPGAIRGLPLAVWLQARGHQVTVITGFPNYPGGKVYPGYRIRWRQWETVEGVRILRLPLIPNHGSSAVGRILNYVSFALSSALLGPWLAGKADVLYVYHPPPTVGLAALVLKALRRLPYVYHIADMWPESVIESGMVKRGVLTRVLASCIHFWCNALYRSADVITVLSPGFKRLLTERGVEASKIQVVYNWTQDDLFRPVPRDVALAQKLGLAGRFNVVYSGNLGSFQALETVLHAAQRLRDYPEIQIVLAGTGQREAELRSAAEGLENVRFLGGRPMAEMPQIHALADVLLVHLRDLDFFASTVPSKTQVALASGRPVLMGVRGDAAAIITDARAGLTCEPENAEAMAEQILKLYRMAPEALEQLGANGRAYYLSRMSLDVGGALMEDIFSGVLERTAPRRIPVAEGD